MALSERSIASNILRTALGGFVFDSLAYARKYVRACVRVCARANVYVCVRMRV